MAILIVDDESNTREVLRELLKEMGQKTVLEARNGQEALKTIQHEKARVELIVADWEMPYMDGLELVKKIAEIPELDFVPFLLITSDLPKSKIRDFQDKNPRLDGYLIKPFRGSRLAKAISEAFSMRATKHQTIVLVSEQIPSALHRVLQKRKHNTYWSDVTIYQNETDATKGLKSNARTLGALFLDPKILKKFSPDWVSTFRKSLLGVHCLCVCLGRDAKDCAFLRSHCHYFIEPEAMGEDEWNQFLQQLAARTQNTWNIEQDLRQARELIRESSQKEASQILGKSLAYDESNVDLHNMLGDALESTDPVQAIVHFKRALELNPFLPHAYVKLQRLLTDKYEKRKIEEQALKYCPGIQK